MAKAKILLVEDNLLVSTAVQDILKDEGYDASICESGKTATESLSKDSFNLVLLDMMLPDANGRELLLKWKKDYPEILVIFMTAHGDIPTAVECLKAGAFDFLTKPVEKPLLLKTIQNALSHQTMAHQVTVLAQLPQRETDYSQLGDIVARAPVMLKTLDMVKLVSGSDFSCLMIKGESGTGKGLLARTIHKMGNRSEKPFVEVNCSAIPANLIESELFGHKKGAFTDAKEEKLGLFEMADGGTLFLDEIGDMDFNLQAKLLKAMEEQKFRRIGGTADISVNVAIIAATNQNVEKLVQENKFRLDLYYRLNVIPIDIPPLRERSEDIPALADHFLRAFARKFGKSLKGFGENAMQELLAYSWPGNVREFRNVVERGCILTKGDLIDDPGILFPSGSRIQSPAATGVMLNSQGELPAMPLAKAEEMVIRAAMREAKGNKNKAASILGLHRTTLYKKLEEYKILDPA